MNFPWRDGNRVELLINGEEYFPAPVPVHRRGAPEILLETFIIFEDEVGRQLQEALSAAAERGVRGTGHGGRLRHRLAQHGLPGQAHRRRGSRAPVRPAPAPARHAYQLFRRLHRKASGDRSPQAFVGGINYGEDHLVRRGNMAKQDYAVRVEGPVVRDIRQACLALLEPDADYLRRCGRRAPGGRRVCAW
ncbi:hypothetical protein P4131_30740 [Pseudomonas aeruginosa]|nr:hypothetical protein [Pseudomonas aeruginosa]